MISWLQSATGAQSVSWTSSASASNATSVDAAGVGRTENRSWTYFADFSKTSSSEIVLATYDRATDSTTDYDVFSGSGATVISSIDSSTESAFFSGSQMTSRFQDSSMSSTRSVTTSTIQTYTVNVSNTQTALGSVTNWTTSKSATSALPVFYSFTDSATITQTVLTQATRTQDTTTTSGTEIHYGLDNTIWQCHTHDHLAEIAYTAPNNSTLLQYAGSAMPTTPVTRWTEIRNTATIAASAAEISQFPYASPPVQTTSFPGLTSEISYTTTSAQTFSRTTKTRGVYPVETATIQTSYETTQASTSQITHYAATTFTTQQFIDYYNFDDDTAYIVPAVTVTEWFNNRTTYTIGNGTISWHEFTDVPSTRTRITQLATANEPLSSPNYAPLLLYRASGSNEEGGTFSGQQAGITMAVSAPALRGIVTSRASVTWSAVGPVGSALGDSVAEMVNLNLGKTFWEPSGLPAYHRRATLLRTVFPSTYEISDTGGQWSGTLSVSGVGASATFAPTNTNSSTTTTAGSFQTTHAANTRVVLTRRNAVGGQLGLSETFFAKWPNGVFSNSAGTVSSTASVLSQTASSETSWLEPVVGLFPATELNTRTVVSYTQLRNNTSFPPLSSVP